MHLRAWVYLPAGSVQTPYSGLTVKDLEARLAEIHSRLDALKLVSYSSLSAAKAQLCRCKSAYESVCALVALTPQENEFLSHKKTMLELVRVTQPAILLADPADPAIRGAHCSPATLSVHTVPGSTARLCAAFDSAGWCLCA